MLRLVADGLNNQAIAERLFVSEHTVHRHVANILNKLSVSSRAAAVAQAARRGSSRPDSLWPDSGHSAFVIRQNDPDVATQPARGTTATVAPPAAIVAVEE